MGIREASRIQRGAYAVQHVVVRHYEPDGLRRTHLHLTCSLITDGVDDGALGGELEEAGVKRDLINKVNEIGVDVRIVMKHRVRNQFEVGKLLRTC